MRIAVAALTLLLAACSQPAQTVGTPEDASAGASGVGRIAEEPFTLESEALVGLWSFARHCGDYDLVFMADGSAEHHIVSSEGMSGSYAGAWTTDGNRVVLTLHRLGPDAARTGEAITYNLDVAAPVGDDLIARFARSDGAEAQDINARRCPEEDRD